jgi:hypothetical protein
MANIALPGHCARHRVHDHLRAVARSAAVARLAVDPGRRNRAATASPAGTRSILMPRSGGTRVKMFEAHTLIYLLMDALGGMRAG